MLSNQTMDKLQALRLHGMAEALEEQRRQVDISQLDFEERLGLLVERQWSWKENRLLSTRLREARLKISGALEDIDFRHPRGLKRAQIEQMRGAEWIAKHQNCLITGPTGSGKTYLACALANQACREGWRTLYYYVPKLFRELNTAQADGSLSALLKKLARAALLVIDDFGLFAATGKQYRDFLEVLDDRQGKNSTIITSQFPVTQWHELINDKTVADAILDRLVHNAYRLELKGDSLRKNKSAAHQTDNSPCPSD